MNAVQLRVLEGGGSPGTGQWEDAERALAEWDGDPALLGRLRGTANVLGESVNRMIDEFRPHKNDLPDELYYAVHNVGVAYLALSKALDKMEESHV